MSTTQSRPPSQKASSGSQQNLEDALDRGELVRLLAELDAGKIGWEEFENAVEHRSRRNWFRRFIDAAFGR